MAKPAPEAERLPPHDLTAEQAVLGCVLLDQTALNTVEEHLSGLEFYDLRHRLIYGVMLAMREDRIEINLITIHHRLSKAGDIETAGGMAYLGMLQESAPAASGVTYFIEALVEKHRLRGLLKVCMEFTGRAYEEKEPVDQLLSEFGQKACGVQGDGSRGIHDVKAVIGELITDYEKALEGKLPIGIQTGFLDLDRLAGGMMPQEMIVLAGNPSSGKTSLALNIALAAAERDHAVGIVSLETGAKKIVHRMLAIKGQYSAGGLLLGTASESDILKAGIAASKLNSVRDKILICDDGGLTTARLCARMRRMHGLGARLFVIDYLQLIQARGESQEQQVTTAAHAVKGVAKELDVPVIIISSINREASKANRKPQLSDLRGSGNIEYDADKVFLLWAEDKTPEWRQVQCEVAKNKDGRTGSVPLMFAASQFRFESQSQADADAVRSGHND